MSVHVSVCVHAILLKKEEEEHNKHDRRERKKERKRVRLSCVCIRSVLPYIGNVRDAAVDEHNSI